MAKNPGLTDKKTSKTAALQQLVSFIIWVSFIIVSLAVGFGMVDGALTLGFLPASMTMALGWIVIILTLIGAVLAIVERLSR